MIVVAVAVAVAIAVVAAVVVLAEVISTLQLLVGGSNSSHGPRFGGIGGVPAASDMFHACSGHGGAWVGGCVRLSLGL